jgi:hypothetical protein
MTGFDPQSYGPAIADLLVGDRLPALGPGKPNEAARPKIQAIALNRTLGSRQIVDHVAAQCCVSALWLAHDFLDESHALSQEIETVDGSYWHGIMHRRELDYGNAKYWFRRVPDHPIFAPLAAAARDLAVQSPLDKTAEFLAQQPSCNAPLFVYMFSAIAAGRSTAESLARPVARAEWQLLFDYCFRKAVGAS